MKGDHSGVVRRSDVHLRGSFPELKTVIYEIVPNKFLIHCDGVRGDFQEFKDHFNHKIRMINSPVEVSNIIPGSFLRIIPSIPDTEIAKGFEGMPLTKHALLSMLVDKFPSVHFFKLDDDAGIVNITLATFRQKIGDTTYHRFLNNHDRKGIDEFFAGLNLPFDVSVVEQDFGDAPDFEVILSSEKKNHAAYARELTRSTKLPFVERDKALWNENVDKIFIGEYKKEDLYFYDPNEYACYVDFSVFPNLDIRNHLFLFQTVFITLPFETGIEEWLNRSRITKSEFIELVARNRIKVVLTQPERRYDLKFLLEVYEASPSSVISRKALATLQQIDIVEITNGYFFNDVDTIRELQSFCLMVAKNSDQAKSIYDMLVWPMKARRNSFDQLNRSELFMTSTFGVNTALENHFKLNAKRDISFDLTVNSSAIHLASALNATYFPFYAEDGYTDKPYAEVMGRLLNFYKLFSPVNIRSLVKSNELLASGVQPIAPIEIMEFNEYVSITELEEVLNKHSVFPESKRLIDTLAGLSEDERKKKIDFYNSVVQKKVNRRKSENLIDIGKNLGADIFGIVTQYALLGTTLAGLKIARKYAKNLPLMRAITRKIEEAIYRNPDAANVHYLTKINRVAKLKPRSFWGKLF